MAWFARINSQIRANRLILANRFRVPELNPLFLRIALWGAKNCESQVWGDLRESRARYENRLFSANRFARIDSCKSPRFALQIAGPSKLENMSFFRGDLLGSEIPAKLRKLVLRQLFSWQSVVGGSVGNKEKSHLNRSKGEQQRIGRYSKAL